MISKLSSAIGNAWESDVTTVVGVLLVILGLCIDIFGAHFSVPQPDRSNAANAIITAGALAITPRQKK